jgi:uncharacterized protein (TIGR02996 family)
MSDEQGLLWDVMENPDDDAPRLILADWLEDHDQIERAELARLHVHSARRVPRSGEVVVTGSTRFDPKSRIDQLIDRLFRPARMQVRCCVVRRGFPEEAELRFPSFDRFAPHFWANPVRHLWLTQVSTRGEALVRSGLLGRLLSVGLGEMIPDDVRRLAEGPPLPRLRFLCLHQQRMEDLILLLSSGVLPPARTIELGDVSTPMERAVFPAGFHFRAKSFGSLAFSISAFASQPFLADVRRLRLATSNWQRTARPLEVLTGSPHLTRLEELELPNGCIEDSDLAALLQAPWLSGLRVLNLRLNWLTGAGANSLASCEALAGLTSLDVRGNRITHGAWRRLEERFGDALVGRPEINRLYEAGHEPFLNPV